MIQNLLLFHKFRCFRFLFSVQESTFHIQLKTQTKLRNVSPSGKFPAASFKGVFLTGTNCKKYYCFQSDYGAQQTLQRVHARLRILIRESREARMYLLRTLAIFYLNFSITPSPPFRLLLKVTLPVCLDSGSSVSHPGSSHISVCPQSAESENCTQSVKQALHFQQCRQGGASRVST